MDTCHYCGTQHHPMPVYTRPGDPKGDYRIHVCHWKLVDDGTGNKTLQLTDCKVRAEEDGYIFRRELTPRR